MPIADSHIHTCYSPDADRTTANSVESICRAAIKKGIRYITLTDHYDIDEVNGINSDIAAIERDILAARVTFAKEDLKILFGLELAHAHQYPVEAKKVRESYAFDFLFGSLHKLTGKADFFALQYDDYSDAELKAMFESYLIELHNLARNHDFDSLAHCVYPLRYYVKNNRASVVDLTQYTEAYTHIFGALIQSGKALEVNSSGLRQEFRAPYPPEFLVKLYYDLGGRFITVGSDSHAAANLGVGIDEITVTLKKIGFRFVTVFENRKPQQIKI